MKWISEVRERLRGRFFREREDAELEEELRLHLELEARANEAAGMAPDAARRQAALAFGGVEQFREEVRDARGFGRLDEVARDVRFAVRSLVRNPGFTAVALLTIALGIGANAAMFSIVNGILLRPLPYAQPEQLVHLHQAPTGGPAAATATSEAEHRISIPDLEDWRARTRAFAAMSGFISIPRFLTGRGEAVEIQTVHVTEGFFEVLGAPARLGRPLLDEDMREARFNAVISERLWRTQLGGDAGVLGTTILIDGDPYTVVGVMPTSFRYPAPNADVWAPRSVLALEMLGPPSRDNRYLRGVARLGNGATPELARRELAGVAAQLGDEFPDTNREWASADVVPLRTALVGDVDRALVLVLAVVGFILLIGCANLANLLLARGSGRSREIAIRTALGAGRMRIVRQLVTESLMLALLGGVLGLLLAYWGMQTILALSADTLPRIEDVRMDGRVVGFGLLLAVLTGLLFGLFPAFRLSGSAPQDALRGGRGTVGTEGQRLRHALVIGEVALAVLLVIGAGLMARSFLALRSVDTGFDPEQVLTVSLRLNLAGVAGDAIPTHLVARREEIIERVRALPGVTAVGMVNVMPLNSEALHIQEYTRLSGRQAEHRTPVRADTRYINPGFLEAMGIPLRRGASLPERVPRDALVPTLVNETAARLFWPGEEAIGQRLSPGGWGAVVVGVVGDVRQLGLEEPPGPAVYMPQANAPRILANLVVRASGDASALAGAIRQVIHDVDPNQPIREIATLEGLMAESIARDRFFTLLFALFGGLALVLAAVGIYGVLAYSVRQRTQEIGVRMALGAASGDVLRMVGGAALLLVGSGLAVGTLAALMLTRVLESQLYGISPTDPATFAGALGFLGGVGALASYLPARRATRVQPMIAIRPD